MINLTYSLMNAFLPTSIMCKSIVSCFNIIYFNCLNQSLDFKLYPLVVFRSLVNLSFQSIISDMQNAYRNIWKEKLQSSTGKLRTKSIQENNSKWEDYNSNQTHEDIEFCVISVATSVDKHKN